MVAADRDGAGMRHGSILKHDQAGGTRAHLRQANSEFPFIGAEHGICCGQRLEYGVIDMDARTTFAYAANKMDRRPLSDPRPFRVMKAIWQALGIVSAGLRAE